MNSLSHLYVAAHLDEMLNLSANERLARTQHATAQKSRLAATVKSAWSLLSGPAERPTSLPPLSNYPFRG